MTTDMMNFRDLLRKAPDADLLRSMIGPPDLEFDTEIGLDGVVGHSRTKLAIVGKT